MSPFVRDGDVITVAPLQSRPGSANVPPGSSPPAEHAPTGRACGIGQIVAFVSPVSQRLVVHRVIGRRESLLLVRGDSMGRAVADVVSLGDTVGRVVRIERGGKRVWLGLGPERYVVAVLSRVGLLIPLLKRAGMLARYLRRRPHGNN